MQQVSAAAAATAAIGNCALAIAVAAISGTRAVLPAHERAGIAPGARRRGVAGAVSGQGSRQWARGTDGQRGASVRWTPASASGQSCVRRADGAPVGGASAAGGWRGSACARSELPLPRALGRVCAGSAAATAVPKAVRCAARFVRSLPCAVLVAQTAQYVFDVNTACVLVCARDRRIHAVKLASVVIAHAHAAVSAL